MISSTKDTKVHEVTELILKDEVFAIVGAAIGVHRELDINRCLTVFIVLFDYMVELNELRYGLN